MHTVVRRQREIFLARFRTRSEMLEARAKTGERPGAGCGARAQIETAIWGEADGLGLAADVFWVASREAGREVGSISDLSDRELGRVLDKVRGLKRPALTK